MRSVPIEDRFWEKVQGGDEDQCWLWLGAKSKGYGQLGVAGKLVYAHRFAWEITRGIPIPDWMQVCHHCDTPECVNPSHLFLGTAKDNMRDMVRKGRAVTTRRVMSAEDVDIAHKMRAGGATNTRIAELFGVTQTAVCKRLKRHHPAAYR